MCAGLRGRRCFNFCLNLTENTSGVRRGRVSLCGFDSLCFSVRGEAFGYLTDKFGMPGAAASYILVNLPRGCFSSVQVFRFINHYNAFSVETTSCCWGQFAVVVFHGKFIIFIIVKSSTNDRQGVRVLVMDNIDIITG